MANHLKRQAKAGMCVLCRVNPAINEVLGTCQECIDAHDTRMLLAAAEKARTRGEILRDGLLGSDDVTGRKRQVARSRVKGDKNIETSRVIYGNPRTGRYH